MNWQEVVVLLIFAGALAYVGQRAYRLVFAKNKAGCEKCDLPTK